MLALYEHPSNKNARPTGVTGSIIKSTITDVDASTSWTVNFTEHLKAQAVLTCSMVVPSAHFGAVIRYKNGTIKVAAPIYRPPSFTVQYFDGAGGDVVREETKSSRYVGGGWYFEADEVARCITAGKIESDLWTHEKTIIMMETFDEVSGLGNIEETASDYLSMPGSSARQVRAAGGSREGRSSSVGARCIWMKKKAMYSSTCNTGSVCRVFMEDSDTNLKTNI